MTKRPFACDERSTGRPHTCYLCPMKMTLLKNYNYFVALIWVILGINFTFQYSMYAPFSEALLAVAALLLSAYPLTTYLSTTLLHKALKTRKMARFILQFVFFSALMALLLLGGGYLFMVLEVRGVFPGSELFSDVKSPTKEVINAALVGLFINFGFCGLRFFEENMKLQQELAESQMEILKIQINPHFMFNVLNHIHVLMQKDVELASSLLLQYSDILRYQLYRAKEKQVTLGEEVAFLKNYVEVEKLRWKGKLQVTTRWEITDATCLLAPLLMITFVENAFKHVARSDTEKGYVDIRLRQQDDRICLDVKNSKSQLAQTGKSSGLGLSNIRKRLDILYPGRYELKIEDTDRTYEVQFAVIL